MECRELMENLKALDKENIRNIKAIVKGLKR